MFVVLRLLFVIGAFLICRLCVRVASVGRTVRIIVVAVLWLWRLLLSVMSVAMSVSVRRL